MHEEELIQGLKKGQESAFAELVEGFKNRIYNTVIGFVQQAEDAEDITQEVFIKVFRSIDHFKGDATLSTWIYRIAVTQSLDFLRKKKRQKRGGLVVSIFSKAENEWGQPDFNHPGIAAEQKENAAVLFKAIQRLPDQQQTAFVLQKVENLSQHEIADVMQTTIGSVESLLQRAKTNLRKLLEDYYQKHYK